ncbi:MAG: 3-deoxy-D-manno-octulosonic acid transferase, partial [Bacteroidia bacterium]
MELISRFVYNFFISIYGLLLHISAFFNPKAKMIVEGRQRTQQLILSGNKMPGKKAWFHCASLGEFEQARPVIEELKKKDPSLKTIITFFSPSGYEQRKNDPVADLVCYLPGDTKKSAEEFVSFIEPDLVFFIKYEFWFHFINEISKRGIPLYLLSASFRKDQIFFRWYGNFYVNMLQKFSLIFVQDEKSLQLLTSEGLSNVKLSGDTRFDNVTRNQKKPAEISLIEKFRNGVLTLVAGSSYEDEEKIIHHFISGSSAKKIKLIIAPHEVDENNINRIMKLFSNLNATRLKDLNEENSIRVRILIIDRIGILSSVYRIADFAFIGGGFGKKGIHNSLEALAAGIPIFVGPNNHHKNHEISTLIK